MNPGPSTPPVQLSASQKDFLTQYSNKRTLGRQTYQRIAIVLHAHQGWSNLRIAREVGMNPNTVKKWRDRWIAGYQGLCLYEQQERKPSERLKRMLAVLSDSPRSGAPTRISLAEKQRLMALACKKPEDFGVPLTQWNREMLAWVAQREGLVKKISPRYVGKLLKNAPTTAP
jgi:putative transposase